MTTRLVNTTTSNGKQTARHLTTGGVPDKLTGMKFHEALGEVIREQRLANEMTLRQGSSTGYVSMGHLSDVENGRKEGSSQFIEAVAKSLGLETYELILKAGYRMADLDVPDTPEHLFRGSLWKNQYEDLHLT